MGMMLQDQGKLSLAEPFLQRAVEGWERTLGSDHPDTLYAVRSLSFLLKAMDKEKREEGRGGT